MAAASPPVPTLTDFTPSEGPVGAEVQLNGTGLLGTSSVKFDGVAATMFTVVSAGRIQATVPAGATTGSVSVTTAGGTAATASPFTVTGSAGLDLRISGLYVTQATQTYPDTTVSLVKDRSAWVRVFVKASESNGARPQVRVRFMSEGTTNTLTIDAPAHGVPTEMDEADAGASWNAPVPAAWIREGLTLIADVDPTGTVPETNRGNNSYPPDGSPLRLDVRGANPLRITLFPVTTGDGLTGDVSASNLSSFVDLARRLFPVPDNVDAAIGTGLASSVTSLGYDGAGWGQVLNEVIAKRSAEGAAGRNYYGVVKVGYGGGVAGVGCVGCPVALGWDKWSPGTVLAHEIGHNFGRPHSPGCGAGGVDPNYPTSWNYAGGHIGVTGWDPFAGSYNLKAADRYNDIMNYCSVQWISDYVFKKVLEFRGNGSFDVQEAEGAGPQEGLLVWGRVVGGTVVLEPAFPVRARVTSPDAGPYALEVGDASGRTVASVPFRAEPVEDLPGPEVRLFSFVLPLRAADQALIHSLRVIGQGRELARAVRREPVGIREQGEPDPVAVHGVSEADESVSLSWDAGRYPLVVVRDAGTGEILGFHRGGQGRTRRTKGRDLELVACDGIGTRIQRYSGNTR